MRVVVYEWYSYNEAEVAQVQHRHLKLDLHILLLGNLVAPFTLYTSIYPQALWSEFYKILDPVMSVEE